MPENIVEYNLEQFGFDSKQQLKSTFEKNRRCFSFREDYELRKLLERPTTSYSLAELKMLSLIYQRASMGYEEGSRWHDHWWEKFQSTMNALEELHND